MALSLDRLKDLFSPVLFVIDNGIGKSNVEKIKSKIDARYAGWGRGLSDHELEDDLRKNFQTTVSFSVATATQFTTRILQERYQFETVPAMQTARALAGDYGQAILGAFERAEEIKHQYGMTAKNVVAFGVPAAVFGTQNAIRAIRAIRTAGSASRAAANAIRTIRTINNVRRILTVGKAAVSATGVGIIVAFGTTVLEEAAYRAVSRAMHNRAVRLGMGETAASMLEPNRILAEYMSFRGVLPGMHDYSTFDNILSGSIYGGTYADLGYDYGSMARMSSTLMTTGNVSQSRLPEYMQLGMRIESFYGRESSALVSSLSRITHGDEVGKATEAFETFFIALTGGGKINVSYLNLVEELTSFTEYYVQGTKYSTDGKAGLAKITQFLFPAYGMQTTRPVTDMVMTTDSVMMSGLFRQNRLATELLTMSGISDATAFHGISTDANAFNQFLNALVYKTGIGVQSFDEEGNLSNNKLILLSNLLIGGMDMSPDDVQSFIKPLHAFVQGGRVEDVHREYLAAEESRKGVSNFAFVELHSNLMEGSRKLSTQILDNAEVMLDLQRSIMDAYLVAVPRTIAEMMHLTLIAKALLDGRDLSSVPGVDSLLGRVDSRFTDPEYVNGIRQARRREMDIASRSYAAGYRPYSGGISEQISKAYLDNYKSYNTGFFLHDMLSHMAGASGFRISGWSGRPYNSSDERLGVRTNVGMDVVIGPRGSTSPVFFPFTEGTVVYAGVRTRKDGKTATYGLSVVVQLSPTLFVSFSHLNDINVRVNQRIRLGTLLGHQGTTGQVTGAHVDIEFIIGGAMASTYHTGTIISNPDDIADEFWMFLPNSKYFENYEFATEGQNSYNNESSEGDLIASVDTTVIDIEGIPGDPSEALNYLVSNFKEYMV